jgi:hypothetical protein
MTELIRPTTERPRLAVLADLEGEEREKQIEIVSDIIATRAMTALENVLNIGEALYFSVYGGVEDRIGNHGNRGDSLAAIVNALAERNITLSETSLRRYLDAYLTCRTFDIDRETAGRLGTVVLSTLRKAPVQAALQVVDACRRGLPDHDVRALVRAAKAPPANDEQVVTVTVLVEGTARRKKLPLPGSEESATVADSLEPKSVPSEQVTSAADGSEMPPLGTEAAEPEVVDVNETEAVPNDDDGDETGTAEPTETPEPAVEVVSAEANVPHASGPGWGTSAADDRAHERAVRELEHAMRAAKDKGVEKVQAVLTVNWVWGKNP